jgi:uncharacterized protein YbaR (Trm112 family)
MHIEFIDLLRCPNLHEDSWLVAAFYRLDGRSVVEGKLGCPVCGAEFLIQDGVAVFDDVRPQVQFASPDERASDGTLIAALLDLSRPGMLALLAGECARDAEAVSELTGARIVALNSPGRVFGSDGVAQVRARSPIPLAAQSLNAIALDETHATSTMLAEAARLLRPRGRLLLRGDAELSQQFHELARDSNQVVAELVGELVPLRR